MSYVEVMRYLDGVRNLITSLPTGSLSRISMEVFAEDLVAIALELEIRAKGL